MDKTNEAEKTEQTIMKKYRIDNYEKIQNRQLCRKSESDKNTNDHSLDEIGKSFPEYAGFPINMQPFVRADERLLNKIKINKNFAALEIIIHA